MVWSVSRISLYSAMCNSDLQKLQNTNVDKMKKHQNAMMQAVEAVVMVIRVIVIVVFGSDLAVA